MEPKFVCANSFEDDGIKTFVSSNVEAECCDYCGECDDAPIATRFEDVMNYITECILMEYDDAANWLPYETAEGGYLGTTFDGYDLVVEELQLELPRDDGDKLRSETIDCLTDRVWCEHDPYGLNVGELAQFSWRRFSNIVKHERRFYFSTLLERARGSDSLTPGALLDRLLHYATHAGLLRTIESGLTLFRARYHGRNSVWRTPSELGPSPRRFATQSNRMSPPGIVMFYGSEFEETALRETASEPGAFSVGEFRTTREILLLGSI